jgi:cytoskeletal protein CcmA (bactofilin family)
LTANCIALRSLSPAGAHVNGTVAADLVVVDGNVEGPIRGGDVILKSQAHVVGDIQHQTLTLERGAYFEGRSVRVDGPNGRNELVDAPREIAQKDREAPASARIG